MQLLYLALDPLQSRSNPHQDVLHGYLSEISFGDHHFVSFNYNMIHEMTELPKAVYKHKSGPIVLVEIKSINKVEQDAKILISFLQRVSKQESYHVSHRQTELI